DVDFRRSQPLSARIMLPNKGLFVEIENVALLNTNQKPAGLSFERGALIIRGLDLLSIPVSIYRDGTLSKALEKRVLSIDGTLDRNGQLDFNLKGRADLAVLRTFKWISSIRGTADTRIKVSGTFDNPIPTGTLTFRDVHVVPRGFGREIRLADGALVRIGPGAKRGWQRIWIADDNRIKGGIDEGTFQFSGWLELKRWTPTNVEWKLNGSDIFYQVPGEYRVTFNPDIAFRGTKILDKENQQMELGGSVRITEGEYNKSFAQFTESFSQLLGASRKTTQYSKPLAEIFPWIDGVKLNLQIFGQNNFFIRSRLNFGKTNLEIRSNVNLGGSYGSPRVSGRISVLEGTLQYGIINRVFEIDRGTIDFSGDPKTPRIDVTARTEVTYEWTKSSSRRISLEEELLEGEEVTVNVLIHISGVFPKLNVRFSTDGSRGRYSQAQLISLVTFGYPDSGTGSVLGFNLTQEVFSLVPKLVLGAFVDELSLGLSEQLGVKISLVKRFGRTLKFKTQVTQTGEESKYQAGFQFKLTDRLSLEGRFRINRKDNTQKYDGKLKYRIPLD
ncbi:MAG: translocation/assembly module TamB domain-containing protein, partial [Myxococcales bacterium]|nr:translocation/assembly module TamB domain-containing protein [Myxococcales bacterium]